MTLQPAVIPTIILVEDDPAVLRSLTFALELEGFGVDGYSGGEAILKRGEFPAKACLVIDYKMPGMNGLDVISHLRARGVKLPAVLITGHATRVVREGAEAAGVSLVEKPFLGNELTKCLRRLLECRL